MTDVEMKEAAVEPAAKGKGTSKAEGASDGKKKFEVKKVRFSVTYHSFWAPT